MVQSAESLGNTLKSPVVHASINSESYSDNLYSNMISGTTAAMSAIMGGVDRLTVLPYDSGRESVATYPKAFSRRIARNVQHLLKLESNLHELNDPAAGSYYIEHLSAKIAEKAWQEFKSWVSGDDRQLRARDRVPTRKDLHPSKIQHGR